MIPNSVTVAAAAAPYEVRAVPSLDLGAAVNQTLPPGVAVILTDSTVGPLHAPPVAAALDGSGWEVADTIEIPAGEASKSLAVYEDVVRWLAALGLPRDGTLFALGGGVVGDLGGFVASS